MTTTATTATLNTIPMVSFTARRGVYAGPGAPFTVVEETVTRPLFGCLCCNAGMAASAEFCSVKCEVEAAEIDAAEEARFASRMVGR